MKFADVLDRTDELEDLIDGIDQEIAKITEDRNAALARYADSGDTNLPELKLASALAGNIAKKNHQRSLLILEANRLERLSRRGR